MKYSIFPALLLIAATGFAQGVKFSHDLSPAEGLVKPIEKPYRNEICLNGSWDFQPQAIPAGWKSGTGEAPELAPPVASGWEETKIKIPSPWNVNDWGGGSRVGKGTDLPYAPGSLYYPSYPSSWEQVKMGWLRRQFTVPASWKNKRLMLHFEAVAGVCQVLVNGKLAGSNMDAYLPFELDITDLVKPDQAVILLVGVRSRKLFDKTNALYSKMSATYPPGSNTSDLVGIWQDVFLQALPPLHIENIFAKPFVGADKLDFDVQVINQSASSRTVNLVGEIRKWNNLAGRDVVSAAEIHWKLGAAVMRLGSKSLLLKPGETRTLHFSVTVNGKLERWSPDHPALYTAVFSTLGGGIKTDCRTERFGWRSFTIHGKDFYLNGAKIQCTGDLQHPFGPYITSRRFAWAWYKMIKDVGGNAVRPHAQPWPRVYYDLADEMGMLVLDEDALFGSSIALNLEEELTWKRTADEIRRLVLRDRNHPAVIGWSIGNEVFAIALLNKAAPAVALGWDQKLVQLAAIPASLDPTRTFITCDGDRDLEGNLPVWSKHFGHGLSINQLPAINKPLVVGESGATYYGKPSELFPFIGLKAYGSYYQRNEALAIDVYQNIVKMSRPLLGYFSPSELCWFGIEHMNLGYHDFTRLPDIHDGIFPGKPYEEGKPGYQYERIPPYVTTFNPGLDPELPVYKPLPMFEAMKAALAKNGPLPGRWDHFQDTTWTRPRYPAVIYDQAVFLGNKLGGLYKLFSSLGLNWVQAGKQPALVIIDGASVTWAELAEYKPVLDRIKEHGGLVWVLLAGSPPAAALQALLPVSGSEISLNTTALQSDTTNATGKLFNLRDLYFSELSGDPFIIKFAFTGPILNNSTVILKAARDDWHLFSAAPENRKCGQEVLYEHLEKPESAALITRALGKGLLAASTLDFTIDTPETRSLWVKVFAAMAIKAEVALKADRKADVKGHDLLLDGPVK